MNKSAWIASAIIFTGAASAAPPPISAFARLEQVRSPVLSPDGRYLAYISQSQGNRVAAVTDLQAPEATSKVVLSVDKDNAYDMTGCRWGNDSRLLCAFEGPTNTQGRVIRSSRMVGVDADGSNVKVLRQDTLSTFATDQDEVLDLTPDVPDTVLVQSYEASGGRPSPDAHPSVFELNIYTGAMRKHTRDYKPIRTFYSDGRGNIRLGRGLSGTAYSFYTRLDGDKAWKALVKVEAYAATTSYTPQSIIPNTNTAYAFGPSGDRRALFKIDLEDKTKPELIFEHALVDVTAPIRTGDGRLLGVFYETDRPFIYYTDDGASKLMQAVKKSLPTTFNMPVSFSKDLKSVVIAARSDTEAGAFYFMDITTGKSRRIGRSYPELDPENLARMRTIEYKAKDGTTIPGYLTVPVGVREEKLPVIVMPHGGPRSRDSWRFNFLRHFLVSRGYAVLQMNFRGSTGFGDKWFADAFQDWGGLTYSDIADGARYAVSQGIADPQRVCIVGWSFGGYSALVGATRNPDLFKCSVSIAGLSDLVALRASSRGFVNTAMVQQQIGSDTAKLRADSPVEHASDIKMPVLLIHGTLDAQASYKQSEDMAAALKKAGKPHKFVTIEKADHGLTRETERVTLLTEIEEFLTTNLGPGSLAK